MFHSIFVDLPDDLLSSTPKGPLRSDGEKLSAGFLDDIKDQHRKAAFRCLLSGFMRNIVTLSREKTFWKIIQGVDKEAQAEASRKEEEKLAWLENEAEIVIFNDPEGELDTSHAVCMDFIDVTSLKNFDVEEYNFLLDMQFSCLQKFTLEWLPRVEDSSMDLWFPPFSKTNSENTFWKFFQKQSERKNFLCYMVAVAIDQFNIKSERTKLKFQKIIATYSVLIDDPVYFTFSAIDLETGKPGLYQAIVAVHYEIPVLCLLRDYSTETILVVLSLRGEGVDEYLAAKRRKLAELPRA